MTTIVGRDIRVECALTFDTGIAVASLTKASPGVATSTAHGLVDGEVGYFSVAAGMVELDQQAVLVDNKTDDTFELAGLATTSYSTWTAGTIVPAATWGTLTEAKVYTVGGGAAAQLDDTRLLDKKTRNLSGLLASQDLTIDIGNPKVMSAALAYLDAQARVGGFVLFKISDASDGTVLRVAFGQPSVPGENVGSGALATGQISVTVPQWAIKPNL
jgi:hypothetical protein